MFKPSVFKPEHELLVVVSNIRWWGSSARAFAISQASVVFFTATVVLDIGTGGEGGIQFLSAIPEFNLGNINADYDDQLFFHVRFEILALAAEGPLLELSPIASRLVCARRAS